MTMHGIIKDKRTIELKEDMELLEGTAVMVDVQPLSEEMRQQPMPSAEARAKFRALIGAFDSGLTDVSQNKHKYLAEAYDERPQNEVVGE